MGKHTKVAVALIFFFLASCTKPEERELRDAMATASRGEHRESLRQFDRVLKRASGTETALTAAREAARISVYDVKDYPRAITYVRYLILHSEEATERESAQKQLASIYFDNLQEYQKAITEYHRLISMNPPFGDRGRYQLAIARSNFYLGRYTQAESEVDDLLKERLEDGMHFDALAMKGNILVVRKQFPQAAAIYQRLLTQFPERSVHENIGLQLAVCYEEDLNFKSAISVLESMRSTYKPVEYVDLRIKRLQERMKNQPGARGFRK